MTALLAQPLMAHARHQAARCFDLFQAELPQEEVEFSLDTETSFWGGRDVLQMGPEAIRWVDAKGGHLAFGVNGTAYFHGSDQYQDVPAMVQRLASMEDSTLIAVRDRYIVTTASEHVVFDASRDENVMVSLPAGKVGSAVDQSVYTPDSIYSLSNQSIFEYDLVTNESVRLDLPGSAAPVTRLARFKDEISFADTKGRLYVKRPHWVAVWQEPSKHIQDYVVLGSSAYVLAGDSTRHLVKVSLKTGHAQTLMTLDKAIRLVPQMDRGLLHVIYPNRVSAVRLKLPPSVQRKIRDEQETVDLSFIGRVATRTGHIVRLNNFKEFYPFHLQQHTEEATKNLHFLGDAIATGFFVTAVATLNPLWLLGMPLHYVPSWIGHLKVERNNPATWRYPISSITADFANWYYLLQGKKRAIEQRFKANRAIRVRANSRDQKQAAAQGRL